MPRPPYRSEHNIKNSTCRAVQIMKFLIKQFSPVCFHFPSCIHTAILVQLSNTLSLWKPIIRVRNVSNSYPTPQKTHYVLMSKTRSLKIRVRMCAVLFMHLLHDTATNSDYSASNDRMIRYNELKGMCKEAVIL